ncbi:hypothetical protein QL285_051267 [Trifolium repens]|nr:hypothetical protein QL285_051267 [Trifolium repens]
MSTTYPSPPPQQRTEAFYTPFHSSRPQYLTDTTNPYTYPQTTQQHYASSSTFQPSSSTFQPSSSTYQLFGLLPPQQPINRGFLVPTTTTTWVGPNSN